MGNSTSSQPFSDSDGGPQYRHHESVLRDAQRRLPLQYNGGSAECFSDDEEQFYSAEEGDSSRSVTPERRRPESSSGEEQIFEDESVDEELAAGRGSTSQLSSPVRSPPNLRTQQTCGRCNVSVFQEHDSIGPELDGAVRSAISPTDLNNGSHSQSLKRLHSPGEADTKSPKMAKLRSRGSPFQPICSGSRQQRLISRLNDPLTPGKRRHHSNKDEDVSPSKKALSESPTKRKRLGYFDSSESSSEEEDEQRGRSRRKRGKFDLSVKKRKKLSKSATESSSDSEPHKKMKESKHSSGEESDNCDGQEEGRIQSSKKSDSPKTHRVSAETVSAVLSPGKRKLRDRLTLVTAANSDDHSSSPSLTRNKGTEVLYKPLQLEQNMADRQISTHNNESLSNASVMRHSLASRQGTGKMGNQATRNAQGKLLPLQQFRSPLSQSQTNAPQSSKDQMVRSISDVTNQTSNFSNVSKRLRHASGAFIALQSSRTANMTQPDGGDFSSSASKAFNKNQKEHDVFSDKNSDVNPFQTVELIPPSKLPSANKTSISQEDGTQQHTDQTLDYMETDDSFFNKNRAEPLPAARFNERPIATPKRRSQGKSIAERFRNFWSKKNVGSNIKSLLSKKVVPLPNASSIVLEKTSYQVFSACNKAPPERSASTPNAFPIVNRIAKVPTSASSAQNPPKCSVPSPPSSQPKSLVLSSSTPHRAASLGGTSSDQRTRRTSPRQASSKACPPGGRTPALRSQKSPASTVVQLLPPVSQFQVLHAQLARCLTFSVSLGELADASAAGLVNWTDGNLTHRVTACSQAIAIKAGALLISGCADYLENKGGPLEAPDVLTTLAGGRFHENVEAILHVVAPSVGSPSRRQSQSQGNTSRALLLQVYTNCLRFAEEKLGLGSLAFPLIGQGDFSVATCIQCFYDSLLIFLHELGFPGKTPSPRLSCVQLVTQDARTTDLAVEHLQLCLDRLSSHEDFVSAVTAIHETYFKKDQMNRDQSIAGESSPIVSSGDERSEAEQGGRVSSGRPRVKRPRL